MVEWLGARVVGWMIERMDSRLIMTYLFAGDKWEPTGMTNVSLG